MCRCVCVCGGYVGVHNNVVIVFIWLLWFFFFIFSTTHLYTPFHIHFDALLKNKGSCFLLLFFLWLLILLLFFFFFLLLTFSLSLSCKKLNFFLDYLLQASLCFMSAIATTMIMIMMLCYHYKYSLRIFFFLL